jgi:uncharacterized protein (DUF2336 family)
LSEGRSDGGVIRGTLARLFGAKPGPAAEAPITAPDPAARWALAQDPTTAPDTLLALARDADPAVRIGVAGNRSTPRQADLILALDDVPEIRQTVAAKVTRQVASLDIDQSSQLWQLSISVLEALARDDMAGVRRLVAETARGVESLPREIATTLGRDREPEVALPALDYPGRISDEDLVGIVETAPDPRVVGAVARRPAIGAKVSAAVVSHGGEQAIATLLANKTAEIDGETLDQVVERAGPSPSWHEALVDRPHLSHSAALRLASFVAERLVEVLRGRRDLAPETSAAIGTVLQQRQGSGAGLPAVMAAPLPVEEPGPLTRARRHHAQGTLSESVIMDAIGTDIDFLIAALSLRSRLPPAVVNKILVSHSAKGLTALAWKAGFTMRLSTQLQLRQARLPPRARLNPGSGGTYPLTPAEMEWQIDFFRTLVPADV